MKKFKVIIAVISVVVIALLVAFSSPTRALKIGALVNGCEPKDVITAEFEKRETIGANCDVYMCTNVELEDRITGCGHSTWYIHRIIFINIPEWAGNG